MDPSRYVTVVRAIAHVTILSRRGLKCQTPVVVPTISNANIIH